MLLTCRVLCVPCVCIDVAHMHMPVCLGVPWVPIHVLWDTGQCPRELGQSSQPCPPTAGGSAAWQGLSCLCLSLAGCVPLSGSPGAGPSQGFGRPGPSPSLPARHPAGRGGYLAGSPLAEAQVQAVLVAPRTTSPRSWADRKIPDIVVQRWLQAGSRGWGPL